MQKKNNNDNNNNNNNNNTLFHKPSTKDNIPLKIPE